jgi:hypothetical protein
MAMAVAVTLTSPRLFSQLNSDYKSKRIVRAIARHYPWCSSRSPKNSSIVRQGVSARAFLGVSPYVPHTREKILLRGSFLSLSNLLTFLAPCAGELLPPLGHIFSVPSRSGWIPEGFGWSCRSCAKCGRHRCRRGHYQQVCGASRHWSLWSGSQRD